MLLRHDLKHTSALNDSVSSQFNRVEVAEYVKPLFQFLGWYESDHQFPLEGFPNANCSHSTINAICAALIFRIATATSKNSARSISGNSICWPERGGHAIVKLLLTIAR